MNSRKATFKLTDTFTEPMDEIRRIGFPIKGNAKSLRDEFDDKGKCLHLTLVINGEIAVYHRFTDNLHKRKLVMQHWTEDKAPVPPSDTCMEMGRFVVAPKFRNIPGLFDCFILMGLIYAQKAGYRKVATMIKDERNLIKRCEKLGFETEEAVSDCKVPNLGTFRSRTLIFDLKKKGTQLPALFSHASLMLSENHHIKLDASFLKSVKPVVHQPMAPRVQHLGSGKIRSKL